MWPHARGVRNRMSVFHYIICRIVISVRTEQNIWQETSVHVERESFGKNMKTNFFISLGVTPFCPFRAEMKLRGWKYLFRHFLIYSYMEKQSARLKILVFRSSQVIGMILTSLWVISRRWGGYKHGRKLTIITWSYIRLCFVISYIKPVS
jgi:hypothetical protein